MEKMKRASLKGILLLVLMLFMLMPLYAFADDETTFSVSTTNEGIIEIGTYMDEPVYYLEAPEGATDVLFSDYPAEGTTIVGLQYNMDSDTNTAPIDGSYRVDEETLRGAVTFKDDLPELDFSNVYFYYLADEDYENMMSFVISAEASEIILPDVTFTAKAGDVDLTEITKVEDAYTYYPYMGDPYTVPVYTVKIPLGVNKVDFTFSDPVLAYNYTKDGTYVGGEYPSAFEGSTTGSVDVNGNLESSGEPGTQYYIPADTEFDVIQVQTPYDSAWNSYMVFGVTFEYADPEPLSVWASLSEIKNGATPALPEGYTWKQYPETIAAGGTEAGTASFTDPAVGIKVDDVPVTVKGQPGFEVSANGVVFEKITCEEKAFDYTPYGGTPYKVDIYTVEVPYTTEKVDFKFTNNVLAYNYTKGGDYLKGWYEGESYMTGGTEATVDVNANAEPIVSDYGTIPADNEPDYVYVQDPYDADWNTALHYIVTFKRVADTKQPMSVKAKKAYTVKAKTLKKKAVALSYKKVMTIKNAKGKLTFKKLSGKKIKVSSTGKITVPKKLKKGKYTIKVKVAAAGKDQYKSGYKTVKFTIKVK